MRVLFFVVLLLGGVCFFTPEVFATTISLPGVDVTVAPDAGAGDAKPVASALKVLGILTVLSIAPALLIMLTSFTRIIVVLTMLRHAFGMQETPPNSVVMSLALFLTLFSMMPVVDKVNEVAWQPYLSGTLDETKAADAALQPVREFMARQTREKDIALMIELSGSPTPSVLSDVKTTQLIPAFMLSELRTAFQIGFVLFLPFLLIDIVVSTLLMAMGMMMVPPMTISLPIKILMFVVIDGWNLVVRSLMSSFA